MTQSVDTSLHPEPISDSDRPKRIANLAAMATNYLHSRDNNALHTVRYVAQVDKDGWMYKQSKVGVRTDMRVILEGTTLTVLKNPNAPPRYKVSIRATRWEVDVHRKELQLYVQTNAQKKTRLLRLHIATEEETYLWKHALESAVNSDITDYYTLGKSLGSGAYGDVMHAFDVHTNEQRAVKIIKKSSNFKNLQHLEREIQVMKSISHPNIVQTYQIFDLKRTIYIVMEYVAGGDLFDFVAEHENLTEAQGSQCIRSIFQAVEYLHRHSIVHRDLKPENILCANNSWPLQIKVTDFGFARFIDPFRGADDTMRTQVGTAYFMAPEIISNRGHGPAVDSWACGVILYTILTGRLPFPGKNTREYLNNVVEGRPLFPAVLWKGISADAMSLVKGLLNVDPNKRLTSLGALQHRWIASPDEFDNRIKRDRSNLHSARRRLFKARKAVIAVAMANKFKATIPQVVDKVGDSTKKVAEGIGEGVKRTAVGVKKVGDGIGGGTKKVAEEIGEGTKKVAGGIAEGTRKVAGGIGTGVKKTVDGVEIGAKKVGGGVKKTADGIEIGWRKTTEGIETGFKKTADGIELGLKKTGEGFKKTSGGIKRGVEKMMSDHIGNKRSGADSGRMAGGSDSTRGAGEHRRNVHMRRSNMDSVSSAVSGAEGMRQVDIPITEMTPMELRPEINPVENRESSCEFFSANEENSDSEEGWEKVQVQGEGLEIGSVSAVTSKGHSAQWIPPLDVESKGVQTSEVGDANKGGVASNPGYGFSTQTSNELGVGGGSSRPKLAPLDGLTMGLTGSSTRDGLFDENRGGCETEADSLRKTAALLLATQSLNNAMNR